jgi:hypothetical protein
MSTRNYDRHGIENLKAESIKPFDRLKIPPAIMYLVIFSLFGMFQIHRFKKDENDIEYL